MKKISVELPDRVAEGLAEKLGDGADCLERFVMEAVAIEAFRRTLLPHSRIAELVGVPVVDLWEFLGDRDVPGIGTTEDMIKGYNAGRQIHVKPSTK